MVWKRRVLRMLLPSRAHRRTLTHLLITSPFTQETANSNQTISPVSGTYIRLMKQHSFTFILPYRSLAQYLKRQWGILFCRILSGAGILVFCGCTCIAGVWSCIFKWYSCDWQQASHEELFRTDTASVQGNIKSSWPINVMSEPKLDSLVKTLSAPTQLRVIHKQTRFFLYDNLVKHSFLCFYVRYYSGSSQVGTFERSQLKKLFPSIPWKTNDFVSFHTRWLYWQTDLVRNSYVWYDICLHWIRTAK